MIYFVISCRPPLLELVRDYNAIDRDLLFRPAYELDWDSILYLTDVDEQISILCYHLLYLFDRFVPKKRIHLSDPRCPWFNSLIGMKIRERDRAYRVWNRDKTPDNWENYRVLRNRVKNMIRNAKARHSYAQLGPGIYSADLWRNKVLVLPLFDYADVVWFSLDSISRYRLEIAFNSCTRYICGLRRFDHLADSRHVILGHSIFTRRKICLAGFVYDRIFFSTPDYITSMFVFSNSSRRNTIRVPRRTLNQPYNFHN